MTLRLHDHTGQISISICIAVIITLILATIEVASMYVCLAIATLYAQICRYVNYSAI